MKMTTQFLSKSQRVSGLLLTLLVGVLSGCGGAENSPVAADVGAPDVANSQNNVPAITATTTTALAVADSSVKYIGPQPLVATDVAKGTLFVTPTGTGSTCSSALPCDIWTAASKAQAGAVVFLRGGTYKLYKNLRLLNKGTSTAPVIYESFPGEKAVFDGSQHAKGTNIYIGVHGKFIQVRGIEIKDMPVQGIWVAGSDIILDGINSHHNGLSGIQITTMSDGVGGARITVRNSTSTYNSGVGLSGTAFANGGNSDGIAVSSGIDNRIENCLVSNNSDDGVDTWKSVNTYVGYSIAHSNGAGDGDGNGIKAGGLSPGANSWVEFNLSHSNKARGFTSNGGRNVTFSHNTAWNNKMVAFALDYDAVVSENIGVGSVIKFSSGIERNNSWQRTGTVAFMSTDSQSAEFLKPTLSGGFEDVGAITATAALRGPSSTVVAPLLPDMVITSLSYSNGIYTSVVKNQGTAAVPAGSTVGVGYSVDGQWKTWGGVWGPLAPGASVTIGTKGSPYVIPGGVHTITAYVDDLNKTPESNDSNNKFIKTITQ